MKTTENASMPPFAERVVEKAFGSSRLFLLPTGVQDVVSWEGSFLVYPNFEEGDELLQELAVTLLDKGTEMRDRFELARVLEDCGAQLHINSSDLRVEFSGQALRKDVPKVLNVLAEMLEHPLFDETEFQKARAQVAAQLQREMESTRSQARGALTRSIFDAAHPNHTPDPRELLMKLQDVRLDAVREYHDRHFGATDLIIACVGDLNPGELHDQAKDALGEWPEGVSRATHSEEARPPQVGETSVPMPEKSNIDVYMGHGLDLRRGDDDYLPLYVGNFILGGNFSARLMAKVRDEAGLTYGIGSSVSGVKPDYDGHWHTNVTLSRDKLDEGIETTRQVIEQFVADGATEDELEDKKTTITGSFKVSLSSTSRLAQTLLSNAERDFPVSYLDDFPSLIEELTLEEVNEAVRKHIHPDKLHVAKAGEFAPAATATS